MKQTGSFVCFLGWATLFAGYVPLAIGLLVIGFTLVFSSKR
jgi:hypothetical protein